MTFNTIVDAIKTVVARYSSLANRPVNNAEITAETRPYSDLGMDSLHDLNIACEVEAILGVHLPPEQKLLAANNRPLSIAQAARMVEEELAAQKPVTNV